MKISFVQEKLRKLSGTILKTSPPPKPQLVSKYFQSLLDSEWKKYDAVRQRQFLTECGFDSKAVDIIMRQHMKSLNRGKTNGSK